jgi:hypothetical protein
MTRLGRWNLRGIAGQIAALVIVSIVALHAIITARLLRQSSGPAWSDRRRPRPAGQAARCDTGRRSAAPCGRSRAGLSGARYSNPAAWHRARGGLGRQPRAPWPASSPRPLLPPRHTRRRTTDRHRAARWRDDLGKAAAADATPASLSIAQAIVLAHGGRLSLLDRSPHGLKVRVVLPAGADDRRVAA